MRIERHRDERIVIGFQLFDLITEYGFDFFARRDTELFHKSSQIAEGLAIAGRAFVCLGIHIVFLDVVADTVFRGSGVKTNGHKDHL